MSEPPPSDGPTARSDAATRLAELLGDVMAERPRAPEVRDASADAPTAAPRRRLRRRDLLTDDIPAAPLDAFDEVADEPPTDGSEVVADEPPTEEVAALPVVEAGSTGDERLDDDESADRRAWAAGTAVDDPPAAGDEVTEGEDEDEGDAVADGVVADDRDHGADVGPERARPTGGPWARSARPAAAPAPAEPVRLRRLTLRALVFGTVLALLIAAIPALGWIGKERLLSSRGGDVVDAEREPTEPGYLAVVEPTPTALVVHRDAEGVPTSAAVLSLGAGDAGGSVLLVPLTLQVHEVVYFNRIIDGYAQLGDLDAFRKSIEDVLGVALPAPTIELSDEDLATLAAPVAPLEVDIARPVLLEDGETMSGPTQIGADRLGMYLRAGDDSESEVARLERIGDVWSAWLAAIGDSASEEPIGAASTGIGRFLRVLSAGPHNVEVLNVVEGDLVYGAAPYLVPAEGFDEQVIDAVPLPASPRPGRRFTIKLLNGDAGEEIPMSIVRDLVLAGGAVEWVGNADELGRSDTLVEYAGDDREQTAELIAGLLGGAELDQLSARRVDAEGVDMVITVGADLIEEHSG